MKRMTILCLCLALLLCGCFGSPPPQTGLYVVTTVFPAYDFARQVVGGHGRVDLLLPLGGEAHGYEPTLQDLSAVQNCDVFIYNGGESDAFAEDLLAQCDLTDKTVIRMMDHVELLEAGEEHHHEGHKHSPHEADEHIWTAPQNGLLIAKAIGQGIQRADPANGQDYEQNGQALYLRLQALCDEYDVLSAAGDTPLLVADRFPFTYLTQRYHIPYAAAFSGCTSNTEADLHTVGQLIASAKEHRITTVLHTEFSDGVLAQTVADSVGAHTAIWHSCHNVSRQDFENGTTYVALMTRNLTLLKEALHL
ncbi:MAG: zinc ABC transporter substrate-binding protein [Clostridia bacterium]|nr:zinc ABC transporter substrate-binding protein [Clostridia bacterium]